MRTLRLIVFAAMLGAVLAKAEKMTIPTQAEQMGPSTPPWLIVREAKPPKKEVRPQASQTDRVKPVAKPYKEQP
jgi:hypothetical protein